MAEYITKDEALLQLTGVNLPKDRDSYIAFVTKRVQDIPAADVAPVIHAKWVSCQGFDENEYWIECSNCGCGRPYYDNTSYCPDCGAKMDKEDKE